MPKTEQQVDHKEEALRLIQWAVGDEPTGALNCPPQEVFTALQLAHLHSNLAIAEGQERVAEELKRLVEGVAFGLRDELQQALSEIVLAIKEGTGNV